MSMGLSFSARVNASRISDKQKSEFFFHCNDFLLVACSCKQQLISMDFWFLSDRATEQPWTSEPAKVPAGSNIQLIQPIVAAIAILHYICFRLLGFALFSSCTLLDKSASCILPHKLSVLRPQDACGVCSLIIGSPFFWGRVLFVDLQNLIYAYHRDEPGKHKFTVFWWIWCRPRWVTSVVYVMSIWYQFWCIVYYRLRVVHGRRSGWDHNQLEQANCSYCVFISRCLYMYPLCSWRDRHSFLCSGWDRFCFIVDCFRYEFPWHRQMQNKNREHL